MSTLAPSVSLPAPPFVLDACALLALLRRETGGHVARKALREHPGDCYVHAANLCEVYYIFYRERGQATAQRALRILLAAGLIVREDFDAAFWQDAGEIKAIHRHVSLADCYCLALARRIGATAVTTDHAEFDPLVPHSLCPIFFLR